MPPLVEGQPLTGKFSHVAKQTTPPPRFTEATLLGAMESAGKSIDDEALRDAMKDRGLGTPATRANIIETLLRRAYIVREKQHLTPTAMGIALVESLPVSSLASPELTGTWEARLARIARSEDSRAAFMADIARYVADMVDAIRGAPPPAAPPPGSSPPQQQSWGRNGKKGRSGRGNSGGRGRNGAYARDGRSGRSGASNDSRDRGGSHGAPNASSNAQPNRSASSSASSSKPTSTARSTSTSTRALARTNAPSSIPTTGGARASRLARPTKLPAGTSIDLGCPSCRQGTLLTGSRGWGCGRWREGCRFVIWFETAGRRLSPTQLHDLVTRGKTRKTTFEPVPGEPRAGRLVLDVSAHSGAARFEPT